MGFESGPDNPPIRHRRRRWFAQRHRAHDHDLLAAAHALDLADHLVQGLPGCRAGLGLRIRNRILNNLRFELASWIIPVGRNPGSNHRTDLDRLTAGEGNEKRNDRYSSN